MRNALKIAATMLIAYLLKFFQRSKISAYPYVNIRSICKYLPLKNISIAPIAPMVTLLDLNPWHMVMRTNAVGPMDKYLRTILA